MTSSEQTSKRSPLLYIAIACVIAGVAIAAAWISVSQGNRISSLTALASAAESYPPPASESTKIAYVEAMPAYVFAGDDFAAGDISRGDVALSAGNKYVNLTTASIGTGFCS